MGRFLNTIREAVAIEVEKRAKALQLELEQATQALVSASHSAEMQRAIQEVERGEHSYCVWEHKSRG